MKFTRTVAAVALTSAMSLTTMGNLALAEASDATKVEATELVNEIKLHPMLGSYGISVVAMDDDTLSVEGMIDDQKAFDALNDMISEKSEELGREITNNVSQT